MTEQLTPAEHSDLLGGSIAARRLNCPASIGFEKLVPKVDTPSVYAREGTALHDLLARILLTGDDPLTLLPYTYEDDDGWSFTVDDDLWQEKGAVALAAFDAYVDALEEDMRAPARFIVENRVQFPGIPGAYGTADVIGRCGDVVFVLDWKMGHGPVEVEANPQLLFYARGAFYSHTPFTGKLTPDSRIELVVVQPTVRREAKVYPCDGDELERYTADLIAAVKAGEEQGCEAPARKGEWCKYARCKAVCPLFVNPGARLAAAAEALQAADQEAEAFDWPAYLADALDVVDQLEELVKGWGETIREQAHAHLTDGGEIAGFKLVAKRGGHRRLAVPEDKIVRFMQKSKIRIDEYMPRVLAPLTKLERLLADRELKLPEKYIEKPGSSGTKIVRDTDAEPAVRTPAAAAASLAQRLRDAGVFTGD